MSDRTTPTTTFESERSCQIYSVDMDQEVQQVMVRLANVVMDSTHTDKGIARQVKVTLDMMTDSDCWNCVVGTHNKFTCTAGTEGLLRRRPLVFIHMRLEEKDMIILAYPLPEPSCCCSIL